MKTPKVPRTVIPATIEGVAGLLTARKWEKAAIVYAWTRPDKPGPKVSRDRRENPPIYTIREFANLGIVGLSDRETVSANRNAWVWAIEHGLAVMVGPGDQIDLDDLAGVKFPGPTGHPAYAASEYAAAYAAEAERAGVSTDAARRAGSNKAAIEAAIKADPEVEQAVREAIRQKDEALYDRAASRVRDRGPIPQGPRQPTVLDEAVSALEASVEETNRRNQIHGLQKAAAAIKTAATELAEQHHHTGVPDEIEWLHEVTNDLTEATWALTGFIVETPQDAR